MKHRLIPIRDERFFAAATSELALPAEGVLVDRLQRRMHDLRISVTDRCNFRCQYCMPRSVFDQAYRFLPAAELLNFDEITRLARLFIAHGVRKVRLTGGEPLLRKNLESLIDRLVRLATPDGTPLEVTLTTNASLLAKKARDLKAAGLARVTVSLDALDDGIFKQMNDADFSVRDVLAGIDAAQQSGLGPIKINMVVQRGVNDQQIEPMAEYFRNTPHVLRFIEYMDVGNTNGWAVHQVLPSHQVVERISARHRLVALEPNYAGEVANRWRYADGRGEIGVISSVSEPFCGDCTRARLSTEGTLFTCLFAASGTNFRQLLRNGTSDAVISNTIANVWQRREDRYSEIRTSLTAPLGKVEMSYIGG